MKTLIYKTCMYLAVKLEDIAIYTQTHSMSLR